MLVQFFCWAYFRPREKNIFSPYSDAICGMTARSHVHHLANGLNGCFVLDTRDPGKNLQFPELYSYTQKIKSVPHSRIVFIDIYRKMQVCNVYRAFILFNINKANCNLSP